MRLVLMGTPGAGKGTQATLLAKHFGACHVSTGDMLRDAVKSGSALGQQAQRFMTEGRLVPDEIVTGIAADRLASDDCRGGFILDGFPRTVAQTHALDAFLAERGQPLDAVILVAVPREEVVRRLSGRRVCSGDCGAMFHVVFQPPAQPDRCDRCGAPLLQREDDREETIRRRLDVYARETAPVLEHYRSAGLVREVEGTGTRDEVFRRIQASVE